MRGDIRLIGGDPPPLGKTLLISGQADLLVGPIVDKH